MTNISETLAATHAHVSTEPCRVVDVSGNWGGAADAYLQLHDPFGSGKGALPSNGAVPKRVYRVFAATPFHYPLAEPVVFGHSCVAAFSSTSATLTIATGAGNTGDIFVQGDGFEPTAKTTEVGDLTTDLYYLDIGGSGLNKLLSAYVVNASGSDLYVMLFNTGHTGFSDDDTPIEAWPIKDGTALDLQFGHGRHNTPNWSAAFCLIASDPVSGKSFGDAGAAATLTGHTAGGFTMLARYTPYVL